LFLFLSLADEIKLLTGTRIAKIHPYPAVIAVQRRSSPLRSGEVYGGVLGEREHVCMSRRFYVKTRDLATMRISKSKISSHDLSRDE